MTDTSALYLVEIVAYDPSLGATRTLRYATGLGHTTGPAESPANTFYDPRIKQPAVMKRTMFGEGTTRGRSTINYGDLELLNGDGELDDLVLYGVDGRAITIRRGAVGAAYPGGFSTDLSATMLGVEIGLKKVVVKLRDRQAEMDTPLQTTKYTGAGLGTLEGVAGDLKGKPKPVCYGKVFNIAPPCVETAKLIYQVHDAAVDSFDDVRDRGVSLTAGAAYASTTDLLDNTKAPSAGQYKTYAGAEGSYFRLGSTPDGLVTCDVTEGDTSADRTVAQVYKRLLERAGKDSDDWNAGDLTALDSAANYVIGFWADQETTYARVFDLVAGSVGAGWFVDRSNVFRIKQLLEATGDPVMTFTEHDLIVPFQRVRINDPGEGLPVYESIVRYKRNYTVQSTDLAAAVTMANRAQYEQEWREAKTTDTSIQTQHLLAKQFEDDSLLTVEADSSAEATRRQTLYGTKHEMLELTVRLDDDTADIEFHDVIGLRHPRYNLSVEGSETEAAKFRVLGIHPNAEKREITFTVWGKPLSLVNWVDDDGAFVVDDDGAYVVAEV